MILQIPLLGNSKIRTLGVRRKGLNFYSSALFQVLSCSECLYISDFFSFIIIFFLMGGWVVADERMGEDTKNNTK